MGEDGFLNVHADLSGETVPRKKRQKKEHPCPKCQCTLTFPGKSETGLPVRICKACRTIFDKKGKTYKKICWTSRVTGIRRTETGGRS